MADDVVSPELLLDNLLDGVYFVDAAGRVSYWNRGAERITGYGRTEALGPLRDGAFAAHLDEEGVPLAEMGDLWRGVIERGERTEVDSYFRHKDGHLVPVFSRINPIQNGEGEVIGALEVFSDDESKLKARHRIEELEEIALIDPLTEVGNRRYAQFSLNNAIEEMRRYEREFGLLFVDIDSFKPLNDTYGHLVGDQVLRMVAHALRSTLRSVDFVGRWGGEEFLIVLPNITDEVLRLVAERCRLSVEMSVYQHDGKAIQVTISLGGIIGMVGESAEECLARVDKLLYLSKSRGKNQAVIE